MSLLPMVRDAAAQPARSWAGVVATSARTDACGLAGPGGLEIPTRTRGLPVDPIEPGTTDVGELLQFSEDRVGSIRPVDSPSRRAAKGSSSVVTPGIAWTPITPMRTWMLPASTGYRCGFVGRRDTGQFDSAGGAAAGTEPYWHLLELPAPPQVQRFRFEWRRGDGPLEVLNPVAVLATSPSMLSSAKQRCGNRRTPRCGQPAFDRPVSPRTSGALRMALAAGGDRPMATVGELGAE